MLKTLFAAAVTVTVLAVSPAAHAQMAGMGGYGQEMCDLPDLKYPRTGDPVKDKKAEAMEANMRAQKAEMCKPGGMVLGAPKSSKAPASPPSSPLSPPSSGGDQLPADYTEVTTFDKAMADCKNHTTKMSQKDCDAVAAAQKDELRYKRKDKCDIIRGQEESKKYQNKILIERYDQAWIANQKAFANDPDRLKSFKEGHDRLVNDEQAEIAESNKKIAKACTE